MYWARTHRLPSAVWNECHGLAKPTKQTWVNHKHGKNAHARGRERASARRRGKVGERSTLTWRKEKGKKKSREEGFISCWPVAASQRESFDCRACVCVCIQECVCSIGREKGGSACSPLRVHCKALFIFFAHLSSCKWRKKTTGLHFSPLLSCSVSGRHVLG